MRNGDKLYCRLFSANFNVSYFWYLNSMFEIFFYHLNGHLHLGQTRNLNFKLRLQFCEITLCTLCAKKSIQIIYLFALKGDGIITAKITMHVRYLLVFFLAEHLFQLPNFFVKRMSASIKTKESENDRNEKNQRPILFKN